MASTRGRRSRKKQEAYEKAFLEQQAIDQMNWEEERDRELRRLNQINNLSINKSIKFKNAKQKLLAKTIRNNEITFVAGSAGTGKTLISLKTALELLKKDDNEFNKILLTKPIVEAGESIGFLPGDIDSKTDPYMGSFFGNFAKLIGKKKTDSLMNGGTISSAPLAYLRGETFENSIAIIDEAQNTTKAGLKLWLSRKGETSKLIVLGDTEQTDLYIRGGQLNGLSDAFERFKGLDRVGFVEFTEDEIVRSDILISLMKRYKENHEDTSSKT